MKKILLFLFTLSVLFSLVACSDSGSREGGKGGKQTTGSTESSGENEGPGNYSKEMFLGEWYIFQGTMYGSDGRIESVKLCTLELNSDGSATYDGQQGTWKFRVNENIVQVKLPDVEWDLVVFEDEGRICLDGTWFMGFGEIYMTSFQRRNTELERQLKDYLACKWYRLGSNGQLQSLVFEENGSVVYQDAVIYQQLDFLCLGSFVFYNLDQPLPNVTSIDLSSERLDFETPDAEYGTFYSERIATPITVDNWRTYFSEDLEDCFEIAYTAEPRTNDWGEVTGFDIYRHIRLINTEKYSDQSVLVVEYLCSNVADYVSVDPDSLEILVETAEDYYYGEAITITIEKDWTTSVLEHSDWNYISADGYTAFYSSGRITRMMGLLIENP